MNVLVKNGRLRLKTAIFRLKNELFSAICFVSFCETQKKDIFDTFDNTEIIAY